MTLKIFDQLKPRRPLLFIIGLTSVALITIGFGILAIGAKLALLHPQQTVVPDSQFAHLAQMGDFIGGMAGALWSLAGVFLFFLALNLQKQEFEAQRAQLELQREELQSQRTEFTLNRITHVIFEQLELVQNRLSQVQFEGEKGETFQGEEALLVASQKLKNDREFRIRDMHQISPFLYYFDRSIHYLLHLVYQQDSEGEDLIEGVSLKSQLLLIIEGNVNLGLMESFYLSAITSERQGEFQESLRNTLTGIKSVRAELDAVDRHRRFIE